MIFKREIYDKMLTTSGNYLRYRTFKYNHSIFLTQFTVHYS